MHTRAIENIKALEVAKQQELTKQQEFAARIAEAESLTARVRLNRTGCHSASCRGCLLGRTLCSVVASCPPPPPRCRGPPQLISAL